jgi:hypothetical protein
LKAIADTSTAFRMSAAKRAFPIRNHEMTARLSTSEARRLGLPVVKRKRRDSGYRSREEELFAESGWRDCERWLNSQLRIVPMLHNALWLYEPRVFELPGGEYRPDFRGVANRKRRPDELHGWEHLFDWWTVLVIWIEVKARHGRNERATIRALRELAADRPDDICVLARYELACENCGRLKLEKANRGWWCGKCKTVVRKVRQWRFRMVKSHSS